MASEHVDRALAPIVIDAMGSARVVAILGPRQAGKSTLATRFAAANGHSILTLDDELTRQRAQASPSAFIAEQPAGTVIDEIQRVPELMLAIKARVDRDNTRGQFLITGSANLRRIPRVADALPGRVDYLTLWPLTQAELVGSEHRLLDSLLAGRPPRLTGQPIGLHHYADRVLTGGFPETLDRTDAQRARFFRDYVQSIVDRDLGDAGTVQRPDAVARLLRLVAARSGSLASYERFGAELGLDGKTALTYADTLERLFLLRTRRAWLRNLGKRQIRSPKLYLSDTGLLGGLLGVTAERLERDRGLAGAMLETFVTNEIERQEAWATYPASLFHFRERDHEVDVVAEAPSGEVVGIEVKAGSGLDPRAFRGLELLRDRTGDAFQCGVLLYTGPQSIRFGDRLWAVPLSALWTPGE
ncbi:MAG: ATP-binding protein [Patulibacter sp.]